MTADEIKPTIPEVAAPTPFTLLASLYAPVDDATPWRIVETDDRWTLPRLTTSDAVLVFGRMPINGRPGIGTIAPALRREVTLLRLRAMGRSHHVRIQRLGPVVRPGFIRQRIRSALLGSALAEVAPTEPPTRVIDAVVAAAGGSPSDARLRPSGNGSALAHLTLGDGSRAELRVAHLRHPSDVMDGFRALEVLAEAGVDRVPRPIASGTTAGAAWTTETIVDGRHTRRLTPALYDDLVDFCVSLPGSTEPQTSILEDVETISRAVPALARRFRDAGEVATEWVASLPSTMLHGDLWLNNVLVQADRLSGVFDWDTWQKAGPLGVDLMNVLATTDGSRRGAEFGRIFTDEFWRSERAKAGLAPYFERRLGSLPTRDQLKGIAIAWWLGRIVAAMYRIRRPLGDPDWRAANIDRPLDRVVALMSEA